MEMRYKIPGSHSESSQGKGLLEGGQGGAHVVALGTLAMSAGALGQLIANPTDVLKVRMQSDGRKVKCLVV